MNNDLLPALEAVNWTISNLPAFEERINVWLKANCNVSLHYTPANAPCDLIIAKADADVPLAFNVEAGAYINTIRSSLDILACALADREPGPFLNKERIYFPVANCAADFASGNYKGSEFVGQLCGTARKVLESHQPYQGGNLALWALHQLDITRKHKRLLTTDVHGSRMMVGGLHGNFIPNEGGGFLQIGKNETVLGGWTKGAPDPQVDFVGQVVFVEDWLPGRKRVIGMLKGFANCATAIIQSFDY